MEEHNHHGHSPAVSRAGLLQPKETPGPRWEWGVKGAAGWEGPWGLGEFLLSCGESHVSSSRGTSLQDGAFAGETLEHPAYFVQ